MMIKYSKIVPVLFAVCSIYSASAQTLSLAPASPADGNFVPYSDFMAPSKVVKKFVINDTVDPKPILSMCGTIDCDFTLI